MPAGFSSGHPRVSRADARLRRLAQSQSAGNNMSHYRIRLFGTGWFIIDAPINNANVMQVLNQAGTAVFQISTDVSGGGIVSVRNASGTAISTFTATASTILTDLTLGNSGSAIQADILQYGYHEFIELASAPASPAAGRFDAYSIENATDAAKSDLVVKDAGGRVHPIASSGGQVDMPTLLRLSMQWGLKTDTKIATGAISVGCTAYMCTGAITLTIDSALMIAGVWLIFQDIAGTAGASNITIATQGAETINGANTVVINANYGMIALFTDGANWYGVELPGAV